MTHLLLVEDDAVIAEATTIALAAAGFAVEVAYDGAAGLAAFARSSFEIAVVDVMLPKVDGITVCRSLRAQTPDLPIVILSARDDAFDVVLGLETGADDYVTKPFDPPVLIARLRALLRRVERIGNGRSITLGEVEIDEAGMRVLHGGAPVLLTPTEYRLLVDLARNVGIARSRADLLESVWGYTWTGDSRLVDVHIMRLRAKLGSKLVETVRGVGYRLPRA